MNDIDEGGTCICCTYKPVGSYFVKKTQDSEFSIRRCPDCQCAYVYPRPSSYEIEQYYQNTSYNNFTIEQVRRLDLRYYPDTSADSNRIIDRCWSLKKGDNFLDVGAGFGSFSHAAKKWGFCVSACEPNRNARAVFYQTNGFKPDACGFDRKFASHHKKKYDVVLLSQVLEHIVDPNEMVQNIYTVLRDNGSAAIAVPHFGSALSKIQGKNDMYISPPEHLNFFSKKGLIKLFQRHDFTLEAFETVTKVNKGRIEDRISNATLSYITWRGLYFFLKIFERMDMGMVINAFFRKIS